MLTAKQLERMQDLDIEKVDKSDLIDITGIQTDLDAPHTERVSQFVQQIKNPYAFRVGDIAVKVKYTNGGISLKEAVTSYLTAIRN